MQGPATFSSVANRKNVYQATISPRFIGQYQGSIKFSETLHRYLWFNVKVNSSSTLHR